MSRLSYDVIDSNENKVEIESILPIEPNIVLIKALSFDNNNTF